jgi:hypothetical protein
MLRPCPFDSGLTEPFGFGEPESRGLGLAFSPTACRRPNKQHFTVLASAICPAGDLKDSILYESHVPPDDKNQDLIRVASPLITPIIPAKHMNPLKHANQRELPKWHR